MIGNIDKYLAQTQVALDECDDLSKCKVFAFQIGMAREAIKRRENRILSFANKWEKQAQRLEDDMSKDPIIHVTGVVIEETFRECAAELKAITKNDTNQV